MEWKITTEAFNVSLHDHLITKVQIKENIILYFENGFDVTKSNQANSSGRHMHTGESAVILHNAQLIEGIKWLPDESEVNITVDEFSMLDFEVLSCSYEEGILELCGDAFEDSLFCKLLFKVSKIEFCWNEFVDEAWFQEG